MNKPHKVPSRLTGVFDYTYEDGVEHFEDDTKSYVVLYELRKHETHSTHSTQPDDKHTEEKRNVYDRLYIYPVTRESFKRYWESDEEDLSVLELYKGSYHFNNPSTEIYPKPKDKVISDEQSLTLKIENIGSLIHNALLHKYSCVPDIILKRIYLKDGLLRIPDEFYCIESNSQLGFQIHTLTSNNLEDSREGLPNSVEVIGHLAFANSRCHFNSLPTNLKEVGSNAFMGCNISVETLPEKVTFNRDSLFGTRLGGLKYLDVGKNFPEGAEALTIYWGSSVGDTLQLKLAKGRKSQFLYCKFYINVELVTDDDVIPNFCFDDCYFYKIVSISKNVKKIRYKAFYNCSTVTYSSDTNRLRELFGDLEKRESKSCSKYKIA